MIDASNVQNLGNRNSQHSFAQIPDVNMARSQFNRSFAIKDTFDFDYLIPIFVDEIIPGDTCNVNVNSFARLATQQVPVLDNMYIDYFFFFVPARLVWDNWEKFNGAQDNPDDTTDYEIPTLTINDGSGFQVGTIFDKFGLPTEVDDLTVNTLPFRCYNLIYNEWFRDQNLIDSVTVNKGDGPDSPSDYQLLKRAKKHDYFTSALPWPQKGDAVSLPLGLSAPVYGPDDISNGTNLWQGERVADNTGIRGTMFINSTPLLEAGNSLSNANWTSGSIRNFSIASKANYDAAGSSAVPAYADLTEATAATINQLREAFMVQSLLELDARGGTRYVEIIKAHFNVQSPDFRLQRPEFLAGGSTSINQHPVPQTSESNTTLQANLAAFSTASTVGNRIGFTKSFTEHGYVIGLAQARGEVTYQQGINKMWLREDRFDFFWPKLQQLGEQSILNKEIYAQGSTVDTGSTGTPDDERVFGYQERYAEYRYYPSQIKGQFRSTFATSLDVWHIAEEFSSLPSLNQTFIESNTPIERSLATADSYPHILFDAYFNYKHARPMMTYGVPATLGRF